MHPREMRTDGMPGAFDASSPADDSVEATKVPALPTQHVLPKALPVALSLIKPASTNAHATQPLGGRPKPRPRTDLVPEKIKTLGCATYEALHPVKVSTERRDLFVQRCDSASELPTRAGQQHDVVHVTDVVNEAFPFAQPIHAAVEGR
jgi:hypothetical protein